MAEIIFDEIKIGEVDGKSLGIRMKKTSGGARSTRESELEKLRLLHPIIDKILEHRELQKLLSTYIDTIPNVIGEDGKLVKPRRANSKRSIVKSVAGPGRNGG